MKYPDPDNLKPHVFPRTLLDSIAENSQNGSFFLLCKSDTGDFIVVPHFNNQPDLLAAAAFLQMWSQTMLENTHMQIDQKMTKEMFGDEEDE
ncbi:MAG: hypothetical protein WC390_06755 [Sulfurimonas sp.]